MPKIPVLFKAVFEFQEKQNLFENLNAVTLVNMLFKEQFKQMDICKNNIVLT